LQTLAPEERSELASDELDAAATARSCSSNVRRRALFGSTSLFLRSPPIGARVDAAVNQGDGVACATPTSREGALA
jgi:hypothetical protein